MNYRTVKTWWRMRVTAPTATVIIRGLRSVSNHLAQNWGAYDEYAGDGFHRTRALAQCELAARLAQIAENGKLPADVPGDVKLGDLDGRRYIAYRAAKIALEAPMTETYCRLGRRGRVTDLDRVVKLVTASGKEGGRP